MKRFLAATEFCDCGNPDIVEAAKSLCKAKTTEKEQAKAIFQFVRDDIKSGMDRFNVTASETLKKRYGGCVGKSNLQIALLRAMTIPARYAAVKLDKEVLRSLNTFALSKLAFAKIPPLLPHVVCSVYLDNHWIFAEAAFDKEIYRLFFQEKFGWNIDWDGENDLLVAQEFFRGDFEFYPSMDEQFSRNFDMLPPLFLVSPMFSIANFYSRRLKKKTARQQNSPDAMR